MWRHQFPIGTFGSLIRFACGQWSSLDQEVCSLVLCGGGPHDEGPRTWQLHYY